MDPKPRAVQEFETESESAYEGGTFYQEHPIDRLKYHIGLTGGHIVKSDFSADGMAYVIWEIEGKHYRAWCQWPDVEYKINWKQLP